MHSNSCVCVCTHLAIELCSLLLLYILVTTHNGEGNHIFMKKGRRDNTKPRYTCCRPSHYPGSKANCVPVQPPSAVCYMCVCDQPASERKEEKQWGRWKNACLHMWGGKKGERGGGGHRLRYRSQMYQYFTNSVSFPPPLWTTSSCFCVGRWTKTATHCAKPTQKLKEDNNGAKALLWG